MTPEAGDYLDKARQSLQEARAVAAIDLPVAAGRAAYLAAYHAAQALICDRTGKITKTHSGARSEFARLAKDDPLIDRTFTTFLAQAYALKEIADCDIGQNASITVAYLVFAGRRPRRLARCLGPV
ncbi:MAG: HEPN domain-containing protein [Methylocella sp.]